MGSAKRGQTQPEVHSGAWVRTHPVQTLVFHVAAHRPTADKAQHTLQRPLLPSPLPENPDW